MLERGSAAFILKQKRSGLTRTIRLLLLVVLTLLEFPARGYAANVPLPLYETVSAFTESIQQEHDQSMHLTEKFTFAMIFVGVVAGLGWWLVAYARKGDGFASFRGKHKNEAFHINVISHRRVTPRLSIIAIEIMPDVLIVLADNGHSIIKLHEGSIQKAQPSMEC